MTTKQYGKQIINEDEVNNEPPTLESIFNKRKLNESKISKKGAFPFFCWLLESPAQGSKPEQHGEKKLWVWPYATHFVHNCFKFLKMKGRDKRYIVAAREDGVYWRGDEIEFFRSVYNNTMEWRSKSDLEKNEIRNNLMSFIRSKR